MRRYPYRLAGEATETFLPETDEDLAVFRHWLDQQGNLPIAVDTEGTGLDTFSSDFRVRAVQFGNSRTAWVLRVEHWPAAWATARQALRRLRTAVFHNGPFDWLVLDRHVDVPLDELARATVDTRILAHLLDSRGKADGGIGHGLKDLAADYVDPHAPDTQAGLHGVFRELGLTTSSGWAGIDSTHPVYVRYAGLDVLLTHRLLTALAPQITDKGLGRLAAFEHDLARVCAVLERQGFLVDRDYVARLSERLATEADQHQRRARRYGVTSVNATGQVAAALEGMGEELTETTATGSWKVDKTVLLPLADLDTDWHRIGAREPNTVADAVLRAKRAAKWQVTYADAMHGLLDSDNRLHPKINALQARTARMSISRPPLQQLPNGDSTVRSAMIAEPGRVVGSVDFSAIEMRVLAALSGDAAMVETIAGGHDLHDVTAENIFGSEFTKAQRKIAKTIGFGQVYGGGAESIARQTGSSESGVRRAIAAYHKSFPGVRRYSRRLTERGKHGAVELQSPTGRLLPLDRSRLYAATNYMIQSTARDIFAQSLLELDKARLTPWLRLPVHDEMVFVADERDQFDVAEEIQRHMYVDDFFGVPLNTECELYGAAWQPDAIEWKRTGDHPWTQSSTPTPVLAA